MGRLIRAALVVTVTMLMAVTTVACTTNPPSAQPSSPPKPRPSTTASATDTANLPLDLPTDETVLGKLENQHGVGQLGPFSRSSDRLAVYFDCVGDGSATITIDGVGAFPTPCDPTSGAPSIRNTFDIRYVNSFSIEVEALDNVTWSIGATEAK